MKNSNLLKNMLTVSALSGPICMSMLVNMIASFVAMLFVAQLGKLELAAAALSINTFMTLNTVTATCFYSIGILISHDQGQHKPSEHIGMLVKNGFWLSLVLFIPSSVLLWNMDKVMLFIGQDPVLVNISSSYLHYAAFTILPSLFNIVIIQFYNGIGKTRFSLIISLLSLPIMILFSYCLVLGNFGFPKLGLAGIACANIIVQTLLSASVLLYLYLSPKIQHYKIFSGSFLPDIDLCKKIFLLGLPIGIQFGGELTAMTTTTYFIGYFGATALASIQIVSQYSVLTVMIFLGLSQGVSILVSKAYGNKDIALVKDYLIATILILVLFFSLVFVGFYLTPQLLMSFYIKSGNIDNNYLIALTSKFFAITGILLLADGIRNILSGVLRGLHDSKAAMQMGLLCLWGIALPAAYVAGFVLNGGPLGVRLGFMSGFILAAWILWIRTRNKINLINLEVLSPTSRGLSAGSISSV